MRPHGTFLYFAYGSNLLTARLVARCPSAVKVGNARLIAHRLAWHKFGCDATGKCDVVATGRPTDIVHGVAWRIRRAERPALDFHEELGTGYTAETVRVLVDGRPRLARTYKAIPLDPALRPLDWYKRFVVLGARQHGLPTGWIARLQRTPSMADLDTARRSRNVRIDRRR